MLYLLASEEKTLVLYFALLTITTRWRMKKADERVLSFSFRKRTICVICMTCWCFFAHRETQSKITYFCLISQEFVDANRTVNYLSGQPTSEVVVRIKWGRRTSHVRYFVLHVKRVEWKYNTYITQIVIIYTIINTLHGLLYPNTPSKTFFSYSFYLENYILFCLTRASLTI